MRCVAFKDYLPAATMPARYYNNSSLCCTAFFVLSFGLEHVSTGRAQPATAAAIEAG